MSKNMRILDAKMWLGVAASAAGIISENNNIILAGVVLTFVSSVAIDVLKEIRGE